MSSSEKASNFRGSKHVQKECVTLTIDAQTSMPLLGMEDTLSSLSKPDPGSHSSANDDSKPKTTVINVLPDEVLAHAFRFLSQKDRSMLSLVCRRWWVIGKSSDALWRAVCFNIPERDPTQAIESSESFVKWLVPRASKVKTLSLLKRPRSISPQATLLEASYQNLLYTNIVAALVIASASLQELTIEWSGTFVVGGWMASLSHLRIASFMADSLLLRPGMESLETLRELRFRSIESPLLMDGRRIFPTCLEALRLDQCNLTELPEELGKLVGLTDLVLSNNPLARNNDLECLRNLKELKQLTLMGTGLTHLPLALSALTNLRVLYLDGVVCTSPPNFQLSDRVELFDVLMPLRNLGILSLGFTQLREFPSVVESLTGLRALYLDNNPGLEYLPNGPYLRPLKVLGIDWKVLFSSFSVLSNARCLEKLCVTFMGGLAEDAEEELECRGQAVVATLLGLPQLQRVMFPMTEHANIIIKRVQLQVALRLAQCDKLRVEAVTYAGISNEWIEWLDQIEGRVCSGR